MFVFSRHAQKFHPLKKKNGGKGLTSNLKGALGEGFLLSLRKGKGGNNKLPFKKTQKKSEFLLI